MLVYLIHFLITNLFDDNIDSLRTYMKNIMVQKYEFQTMEKSSVKGGLSAVCFRRPCLVLDSMYEFSYLLYI